MKNIKTFISMASKCTLTYMIDCSRARVTCLGSAQNRRSLEVEDVDEVVIAVVVVVEDMMDR